MQVLIHELLHTLGRRHPDPRRFPDTIMKTPSSGPEGHVLHPLDRDALLAVYGRLEPGPTPASLADDLGPWETASVHVRGDLATDGGAVSFGVGLRNGLGQPWATGPAPLTNLRDNRQLSGSATWSGRLLGLTPAAETVAGRAALTVRLATLEGDLSFSGLESSESGAGPGTPATGSTWRTGALDYSVSVRGNTFVGAGGDDGEVTGAFSAPVTKAWEASFSASISPPHSEANGEAVRDRDLLDGLAARVEAALAAVFRVRRRGFAACRPPAAECSVASAGDLGVRLPEPTGGDKGRPLVFFRQGWECRLSYNASLSASAMATRTCIGIPVSREGPADYANAFLPQTLRSNTRAEP